MRGLNVFVIMVDISNVHGTVAHAYVFMTSSFARNDSNETPAPASPDPADNGNDPAVVLGTSADLPAQENSSSGTYL